MGIKIGKVSFESSVNTIDAYHHHISLCAFGDVVLTQIDPKSKLEQRLIEKINKSLEIDFSIAIQNLSPSEQDEAMEAFTELSEGEKLELIAASIEK